MYMTHEVFPGLVIFSSSMNMFQQSSRLWHWKPSNPSEDAEDFIELGHLVLALMYKFLFILIFI